MGSEKAVFRGSGGKLILNFSFGTHEKRILLCVVCFKTKFTCYICCCSKSNAAGGHGRDRDSDRSYGDKLVSQAKRDSSPPPFKRVRRDM